MKTFYKVVVYDDRPAAPATKVVKTLAEAAARLESAGDRVFACDKHGLDVRSLTEAEQSELDSTFRRVYQAA
jgi:hypothetical protein